MSTDERPVIFGLTGGIASGKSTVSNMFRDLGAKVIDADQLARRVVEPGSPALAEIRQAFGDALVSEDGTLDREALGARVFSDADARQKLESITHPRIAMAMQEEALKAGTAGADWVIYDAALIVENGLHRALAGLVVVAADPELQIERLIARDDLGEADARARLDAQLPLESKVEVADWVIDNNGSLDETRSQVEDVYRQLERHGQSL